MCVPWLIEFQVRLDKRFNDNCSSQTLCITEQTEERKRIEEKKLFSETGERTAYITAISNI